MMLRLRRRLLLNRSVVRYPRRRLGNVRALAHEGSGVLPGSRACCCLLARRGRLAPRLLWDLAACDVVVSVTACVDRTVRRGTVFVSCDRPEAPRAVCAHVVSGSASSPPRPVASTPHQCLLASTPPRLLASSPRLLASSPLRLASLSWRVLVPVFLNASHVTCRVPRLLTLASAPCWAVHR